MPDYSKGKVYRILQDNDKTVYIGSTTQPLSARMAQHRKGIKHSPHLKLYTLMAAAGVDHFSIELVVDFPCERGEQLHAEEGRHIRLNKTADEGANKNIAGRAQKEYKVIRYAENREAILEQKKNYNVVNQEAISARRKIFRATHKEAIAASMHAYNVANREALAEYRKNQRVTNKDAVRARENAYNNAHRDARLAYHKAWYQRKKAERAAAAAEPAAVIA